MSAFTIGEHDFLLDGQPFRVLAGALHYFRVHPDLWADRIRKAKQMGLNTIETYVAWNAHAPHRGTFDLEGRLDLARFLDLVAAEGMYAIVRPGPYICAEWDNGGLPAWLFEDESVRSIRTADAGYLAAVREYLEQLGPILAPRQIDAGGPIILVQIENEYGAYGSDAAYLEELVAMNRAIGVTVPFTTVDQPVDLAAGSLDSLHRTASFGSRSAERLAALRAEQPTGPLMCSEFWDGWFDNWGGHHHTTDVRQSADDLAALLAAGASVNIYMFHGGTNFGFTNGANDKGVYQPIVTSYDYDAPLDEAGNPTPKYWAFREALAPYAAGDAGRPAPAEPAPVVEARFESAVPLWDALPAFGAWQRPGGLPTMDAVRHYAGYALYRHPLDVERSFVFEEVRDRAQAFVDRTPFRVLTRELGERSLVLPADAGAMLELLVEDAGRVDYGSRLGERKGLIGASVQDWDVLPLDLEAALPRLRALLSDTAPLGDGPLDGPVFARATLVADAPADLFLSTAQLGKGVAWFNGFPLGRYWSRGPQRSLYVPGPLVRAGENELIVFETDGAPASVIRTLAAPSLGHTEV